MKRFKDLLRRTIAAIEPWYDWGSTDIWRMDAIERDFSDESYGPVRFIALQWLGIHIEYRIGRTPPKIPPEEVAYHKERQRREVAMEKGDGQ